MKEIEVARDLDEANFSGCTSWCDRFMKRKGLLLRRKTCISQKMPQDYEEKMMAFQRVIKMHQKNLYELGQIGNTDEVPMCLDMPLHRTGNKTGENTVQIKTMSGSSVKFFSYLNCRASTSQIYLPHLNSYLPCLGRTFSGCVVHIFRSLNKVNNPKIFYKKIQLATCNGG